MTDRELLEQAAKAAGIDKCKTDENGWFYVCPYAGLNEWELWNPLIDDGDALRLAVKLNLHRAIEEAYQHIDSDGDLYAATRRAIVRAAAKKCLTSV